MSDKELRDFIRTIKEAIDTSKDKEEALRRLREMQESLISSPSTRPKP